MKLFYSITALCTALSTGAFCDQETEISEARISQIEIALEEHSKLFESLTSQSQNGSSYSSNYGSSDESQMKQQNGKNQDMTMHSAHGCMDSGFTIQADFLYWRANMDTLEYVAQGNGDNILVSTSVDFKEPSFEYDPGVRVGIGYDFGHSNWDVNLAWTYHYTDVSNSSGSADRPLTQIATKFQTFAETVYNIVASTTAKTDWQTRLNAIDLECGYDHFFSKQFSLRPHFGLKAAWIDMHYNVAYTDMVDSVDNNTITTGSMRTNSDFWAVGPRMGFDSYLHIGWGFSLYGKFAGALVYGEYDSSTNFSFNRAPVAPFNTTGVEDFRLKNNGYSRLRALTEMSIGLEWGYCFSNDYYLGMHIGWENQYWWNQMELYFLTTDFNTHGDLTYSGLDAGFRFDF